MIVATHWCTVTSCRKILFTNQSILLYFCFTVLSTDSGFISKIGIFFESWYSHSKRWRLPPSATHNMYAVPSPHSGSPFPANWLPQIVLAWLGNGVYFCQQYTPDVIIEGAQVQRTQQPNPRPGHVRELLHGLAFNSGLASCWNNWAPEDTRQTVAASCTGEVASGRTGRWPFRHPEQKWLGTFFYQKFQYSEDYIITTMPWRMNLPECFRHQTGRSVRYLLLWPFTWEIVMKSFPSEKSRTLLESSFFNLSSGCLAFCGIFNRHRWPGWAFLGLLCIRGAYHH